MKSYVSKRPSLVKNQKTLKYEIHKREEQIKNKYKPLLQEGQDNPNLDLKQFYDNVMKITNTIASDRPKVLDSEYKAMYYIQKQKEFVPNSEIDKELSGVDKVYSEMNKSLFHNIIAAKEQTPEMLMKKSVTNVESVNYSMNKSKANMVLQTVEKAYKKATESTIVAYDLETYGGLSSKTGAWSPRGITEFSFQEFDAKSYLKAGQGSNFEDFIIKKETAVMGMTRKEADEWYAKISASLTSNNKITDEELIVSAKRFQMYGNATFSKTGNGITVVDRFPGDEVFKGGYKLDEIKKGLDELVAARDYALGFADKKTGLLPYHEKFFKEISRIQNQQLTTLDFNGLTFDQAVMNGVLNSIITNEYKGNTAAVEQINKMFNTGYAVFDPESRIDAMGIFKEASQIAGTQSVYGEHHGVITKSIGKNRLHRQETFMEAFNPELMNSELMDRHKAEDDTTNVLRAVFEKLDTFKDKNDNAISPFQNAMDIVRKDREGATKYVKGIRKGKIEKSYKLQNAEAYINQKIDNKFNKLKKQAETAGVKFTTTREDIQKLYNYKIDESKVGKKVFIKSSPLQKKLSTKHETIDLTNKENYIFRSRGELSGEGRNMLDFTYDELNGTIRTKSGYIIGGNDEVSNASKGVVKAGFRVGGSTTKGAYYKVGGVHKHVLSDEEVSHLTDTMPEYANKHLYVLRLDPYFSSEEMRKENIDNANPIFRVFTSKDRLEAELSNDLELIAIEEDGIKLLNRDDFAINTINAKGLDKDIVDNIHDMSDKELLDRDLKAHYAKKVEETGIRHISTKTAKKTLDYDNLKRALMAELDTDTIDMKAHLLEAKKVSEAISRGEDVTLELQEKYNLVKKHLGFNDGKTNVQQLYSNTLNNYIKTSTKFDNLSPVTGELRSQIKESSKEALEIKMQSALDYLVDDFAKMFYDDEDYLINKQKEIHMTTSEMKSVYQVDVSRFQSDRRNAFKIKSNISTMDEDGILSINLNTSPMSFAEKVRDLMYGDNSKKQGLSSTTSAMIDFVDYLREDAGIHNQEIKDLQKKINRGEYLNPSSIAEGVLRALSVEKEKEVSNGIIRNTYGKFNPLEDDEFLAGLNEYISTNIGKKAISDAVKQTPGVQVFDPTAKNASYIDDIVNNLFMPTIRNSSGETLVGDKALQHILNTNSAYANSKVDADIFKVHWNAIKKSHKENIETLSNLINNTGGQLLTLDGTVYAKYGDEAIPFKSLARTSYEADTLVHVIDNMRVAAHMDLDMKITKGGTEAGLVSNLEVISKSIRMNKKEIEAASRRGDLSAEMVDLFRGYISKDMRKESVISTFNVHERAAQNKLGVGKGLAKVLKELVGVDGKEGILNGSEIFDKDALKIIREEFERLGDNWDGKLGPQMLEAIGKNIIPILKTFDRISPELDRLKDYISMSGKDNDLGGKHGKVNLYLASDRYMQGLSTGMDAAKRPTLQAGKIDFDAEKLEEGMFDYIHDERNQGKFGMVGSLFEDKKKSRTVKGVALDKIESAISIKKANVGNLGLKVITENNFKKVMSENDVDAEVREKILASNEYVRMKTNELFKMVQERISLQEQQKVIDSRLVDNVFEYSANVQHIRSKDMSTYYMDKFDVEALIKNTTEEGILPAQKKAMENEMKIADRIRKNIMQFSYDDNGSIKVFTPEGSLVQRGDKVLSYFDKFNPSGKVSSKIDMGRFQHGVFERTGNIRLDDKQVMEYLNKHLKKRIGESNEELSRRALELLDKDFKVNFFISDIRQSNYTKYMNDAVEKDMTSGLYLPLGALDDKIKKSLQGYTYDGQNMGMLVNKIIKKSELDTILKDYAGVTGGYASRDELMKAISSERHALSDLVFRGMEEFRDVSMLANHQTGKHKNYGMISENVIGSVFETLLNKDAKKRADQQLGAEGVMNQLVTLLGKYDVFDKDTMEIKTDGSGIYLKPKAGKESHSSLKFTGQNLLEDTRYLRLGGLNEEGKEIGLKGLIKAHAPNLYHENARYYNEKTQAIETMEALGEITFSNLTFKNKDGKIVNAENVALISKGISITQQAVDPETMTTYDADVVNALTLKRNAQRTLLDMNSKELVQQREDKYKKQYLKENNLLEKDLLDSDIKNSAKEYVENKIRQDLLKAQNDLIEAQETLAGYEEFASHKKIGKQEFGIYSRAKWNYSTTDAMNKFVSGDLTEEQEAARREFIAKNASAILKEGDDGQYILKDGLEGQSAYRLYTQDLIASKVYNDRLDIELKKEYLDMTDEDSRFKPYAHLKTIREDIIRVSEEIGEGKVSIRYAEDLYQAKSAIQASQFNSSKTNITVDQMKELGFKTMDVDDLITHGMQQQTLADKNINTIYNDNILLYLGEDFGDKNNPNAYLALPKAGKVLEDTEVSKKFQSQVKQLQEDLETYNEGNFLNTSDYADRLRNKIRTGVENIKESINKYTYDKNGILHDLSTVYSEDAFRLKFSFVNNSHNFDGVGDDSLRASLIEKDSHMLKVAKINGTSIADLEKNGIYTDYAFVSEEVFDRMGYFNEERLSTLPGVKKGLYAWDDAKAKEEMMQRLRTDGIITNAGRYPMIMEDSEKATRVFLGDVQNNQAMVSVVTALSMNADNDGDSASFSILKTRGANGFNDYLQHKINEDLAKDGLNLIGTDEEIKRASQFFGEIEGLMAYKAVGINNYYHKQSMDDIHSELSKSIDNGTITEKFSSIKNKYLFNEMLYANNGQSPDTKVMRQNKERLDMYSKYAQQLDPSLKEFTPIDVEQINASVPNQLSLPDYYDKHIKVLEKAKEADPDILKKLGLGENAITDFREHAIARSLWFESLEEGQSKFRKGSIGPINVVLQKVRAGADALYANSNTRESVINSNIANEVAYELEQEVISAKHGSVVSNITKAKDLRRLTDNMLRDANDENRQLMLDFFNGTGESKAANLDDKTINKIWDKLETKGVLSLKTIGKSEGDEGILEAKRSFIGNRYIDVLSGIGSSQDAKRAMAFNSIGGTGASFDDFLAPMNIDSAGKLASAIINEESYNTYKAKQMSKSASEDAIKRVNFSDVLGSNTANLVSEAIGSFKGNGLALGALSVAAGVLVSGFAGSPVDQSGASELAKQEEVNNESSSAPVFLDHGQQVTRSSSRGYIINMKASSSHDVTRTKKALRNAASQSVGGGVNVNMTIRNREVSNDDIEQFITGL